MFYFSQPTIPEEGPEHAEEEQSACSLMSSLPPLAIPLGKEAPQPQQNFAVTSTLKPKPESRAVKNVAQELVTEKGLICKDIVSTIKKSSSPRAESKSKSSSPTPSDSSSASTQTLAKSSSSTSSQETNVQVAKSPKVSRHESMERTVQRITKVIRGSSRSESRSKKNRETSLSPSTGSISKTDQHGSGNSALSASVGASGSSSSKSSKKEGKKNAHEKREIFKSLH